MKIKTKKEFIDSSEYLPRILRDFHDQKDVFKTIHNHCAENESVKKLSWIDAHCYTVDIFLWFMARHGYTLQKPRAKVEFDDLRETIREFEKESVEYFNKILTSSRNQDPVHNSHCCAVCGWCKYGDDDCPVLQGKLSGIICEDCAEEDDFPKNDLTKAKNVVK